MKKRYVAKISNNLGRLHEYELSPRYETKEECLKYINSTKGIITIECFLEQAFCKLLWGNHYIEGKENYKFSLGGSFIRVYDLEQKRFIDSFDL